jgi:hypothetical protein
MVASIIKTVQLGQIRYSNGSAGALSLTRWGLIESYLVIITTSIPCLRSLFIFFSQQFVSSHRSMSYELSHFANTGSEATQRKPEPRMREIFNKESDTASVRYLVQSVDNVNNEMAEQARACSQDSLGGVSRIT